MGGGEVHVDVGHAWLKKFITQNESQHINATRTAAQSLPLSVEMPSRVSVLPLLIGQRSGEEGGRWDEIR